MSVFSDAELAYLAWYDNHVAPNLPAGMGPISVDYVELLFAVPES